MKLLIKIAVVSEVTEKRRKPSKPFQGFPLYAHSNGSWAKKIGQRTRYFELKPNWPAKKREKKDA